MFYFSLSYMYVNLWVAMRGTEIRREIRAGHSTRRNGYLRVRLRMCYFYID